MLVGCSDVEAALRGALSCSAARIVAVVGPPCCGKSTLVADVASSLGISVEELPIEDCNGHAALETAVRRTLLTESLAAPSGADVVVLLDNLDAVLEMDRAVHASLAAALRATPKRVLVTGSPTCRRRLVDDWGLGRGAVAVVEMRYPPADAAAAFVAERHGVPLVDAEALARRYRGHVHAMELALGAAGAPDAASDTRFIGVDVYDVAREILDAAPLRYEVTERLASFEPTMLPALLYETALARCRDPGAAKQTYVACSVMEEHAFAASDAALHQAAAAMRCHAVALACGGAPRAAMRYNQVLNRGATRVSRTRRADALGHAEYLAPSDVSAMMASLAKSVFSPRLPALATMPRLLRDVLKAPQVAHAAARSDHGSSL